MKRFYPIVVLILLGVLVRTGYCQSVVIPDVAFRNYLLTNHPTLMNGSQQLIVSAANAYSGSLNMSGLAISNLSGIENFTSCYNIDCSNNQLTSFPDLSPLASLQTLTCSGNQLTAINGLQNLFALQYLTCGNNQISVLPNLASLTQLKILNAPGNNLTALPGLSGLTALTHLYCFNNDITSLENLSGLVNLIELVCKQNQLTSIPSLSGLSNLVEFDCSDNPISNLPDFTGLVSLQRVYAYSCNLTSIPDMSVFSALTTLDLNNNALTALPDFSSNANLVNLRVLYNQLTFEDLEPLITHPSFASFNIAPQDSVGSSKTLKVEELKPITLTIGLDNGITTNQYTWIKDSQTLSVGGQNNYKIAYAQEYQEGNYYGRITSTLPAFAGITLNVRPITLSVISCRESGTECHPVITPDDDGINDSYFVPESGTVKVFSKNGNLVSEFTSPGSWDGRDKSGKLVTMGVYLMVFESNESISITVIK